MSEKIPPKVNPANHPARQSFASSIEHSHFDAWRVFRIMSEFVESFAKHIGPEDKLWLTEVYYPGGTISSGISTRSIYEGLKERGTNVAYHDCREKILAEMAAAAQPGDILLVLGARDPTLTDFARKLLAALKEKQPVSSCSECMLGNCCLNYNK